MRIVGAALVALAALWPAGGEAAPKAKPAPATSTAAQPPKPPAPGTPRAVYAAMPEHERMTIQADLIWTGDYNGLVDTEFGDNSVAAVKAFHSGQCCGSGYPLGATSGAAVAREAWSQPGCATAVGRPSASAAKSRPGHR